MLWWFAAQNRFIARGIDHFSTFKWNRHHTAFFSFFVISTTGHWSLRVSIYTAIISYIRHELFEWKKNLSQACYCFLFRSHFHRDFPKLMVKPMVKGYQKTSHHNCSSKWIKYCDSYFCSGLIDYCGRKFHWWLFSSKRLIWIGEYWFVPLCNHMK